MTLLKSEKMSNALRFRVTLALAAGSAASPVGQGGVEGLRAPAVKVVALAGRVEAGDGAEREAGWQRADRLHRP